MSCRRRPGLPRRKLLLVALIKPQFEADARASQEGHRARSGGARRSALAHRRGPRRARMDGARPHRFAASRAATAISNSSSVRGVDKALSSRAWVRAATAGSRARPMRCICPSSCRAKRWWHASAAGEPKLLSIERASPDRIVPVCGYFGTCGGCKLQHWRHEPYLAWKRELVAEALAAEGIEAPVAPIIDAHGAGRRRVSFHARRDGREGAHRLHAGGLP